MDGCLMMPYVNVIEVETLIQHKAIQFMSSVPRFGLLMFEKNLQLVSDTTELLSLFLKVNIDNIT